ncbi:MAG: 2-phosphosulfolactate phosphatase [Clostridiaceae bacterium]|nr:2-phosphosulfolactate phosphatase [Eubacteriales bacterium]
MRVETFSHTVKVGSNSLSNKTVIVVDVLRATTSIICAIKNGAKQVVPAADAGAAVAIASRLGGGCVLAGERGGFKLNGFTLGNSPFEFSPENVADRSVVFSTTNGTVAIHAVQDAKNVLIGAMINRTAVAKRALALGEDIIIACAGTDGLVSADDICAAGAIADALARNADVPLEMSDLTLICSMIYADWIDGRADLSMTKHFAYLQKMGFEKDVEFCFKQDLTDVVPLYENGIIVK